MTEANSTAGLSRLQKQEQLRRLLVERISRTRTEPASYAQERLWFLNRLEPESPFYNMGSGLRLEGALDPGALERALGEIVRRHEPLRTILQERDGIPVQVVAPFTGFALPRRELACGDGVERDAEVRRQVSEWLMRPYDLAAGPLFRAELLRLGEVDHLLLLGMHHVVADEWSMGVLYGELSALYEAYRGGRESPLPELSVRYADHAVQQREQLQGEVLDGLLSYWREQLAGAPALLDLPTDRPRPQVQSYRGAHVQAEFAPAVLERLRSLGQREGATPYMVMLGAFQVLLSKYSGSEDVVVGSSIAGRTRREAEALVGFFVNTLVLRTDLSGDPSFREVVRRVRAVTLGAYEHQEIPFDRLVAELHPERSLSHSPLFQVMYSQREQEDAGVRLPGLRLHAVYPHLETVKFDLNLGFAERPGGLSVTLGYRTDLFDRATVERMLAHLGRVLEQVAADPGLRLSELEMLSEAARRTVVEAWNATAAAYPAGVCIHELFEAQAARTPDAPAVSCAGISLRYAELDARANRLAHHLAGLGVGPDARVGICVERSLETVVALLAILKAGGAYVPLDPAYPADRLRYMLEDSDPAVLVTEAALRDRFAALSIPVVALDADAPAWAGHPAGSPASPGLTPDHLAYVIYTSGSTGTPKGVMNQHRCVVNRLAWSRDAWELGADESVLYKTSLNFDGSLREVFLPLMVGARVVVAHHEGHRDPAYLLDTIRSEGIGTVNLVPSMLQLLLEQPGVEDCPSLRRVLCGGEVLPGALLQRFHERLPQVVLHNLYGPSEAGTAITSPDCRPEPARATVPIGRPIANTAVYVLDGARRPVPVGVRGELYIGGTGVARGYLDRPGLTAERFVPDHLGGAAGVRLYRTGDLARWLADGRIEFLGRNDFQVKVRGFRVEPGEVEGCLADHPGVTAVVVTARESRGGDQSLVAYYVAPKAIGVEALRARLSERLPDYMVPAAFVWLERLPLTPNGKLDRDALPAPEENAYAARAYESPVGDTEVALAEIWADVLGVQRVGRRDHFFELGGHSLRAVQVISRVRQVLEAEVPLGEVFLKPVLADFARALEQAARTELPPIAPVDRSLPLPLSFAQQRLWFVEQMGGTGTAYHIPKWLRLAGRLERGALGQALDRIVARHEALRTTIAVVDGEPVQRITPAEESAFPVREDDLDGHPDAAAEVRRMMAEEAGALFDLARGPLIRARLIHVAPDDQLLLITMHHIVSDGWSMGVLIHELGTLYTAFLRGAGDSLPPLQIQYADYAAWQRRWVKGDVLRQQADYWKASLTGAPERLELPLDRPRPAQQDFAGGTVGLELDEALTAGLKALSRRHGTTLFMTLLAGWAAVLSRLSGQGDVVVGTPAANRGRREIEGLIGFFINTLALRLDLSGAATVPEVLARVKARVLGAQQHQDIPFEQVVELVQPARTLAHSPLFQAIFVWQNTPRTALELPELTAGPVDWQPQLPAKYDLSLTLSESGRRIRGGVVYAASLFERPTVERWSGYLQNALRAMVADEERPMGGLPLLDEAESRLVLQEWNRTESAYPRGVCIHELFEAQARARPDSEALVWGGASLTYRELNARANQLAHRLVREGVGPDARVGVLLERGAELIVSLLAVLKAGGCYVPLDPSYPAERLRLMLADSDARVLLSRSGLVSVVSGAEVRVLCVDRLADEPADGPADGPAEAPRGGATAENLAYIVYTSGSTGKPKGVMVAHRHVIQLVCDTDYVRFGPGDRIAQASNASFDALTFEVWGAFLNGATLVGIDHGVLLSTPALRTLLREARITTLYQTTALLNQLAREQPNIFSPLREVLFGGQAADADGVRRLLRAGGPRRLLHMYGPTETTAWCSWEQVEHVPDDALTVSVGRPTANQRIYLLDAGLHPVPVGVPGEAYVGGDGVVRGYLDRPGLTAERFLPDPFAVQPGARMYRTGDRLRWKADGRLEFIGRVDEQVKIRGFRIEPGEVESVLGTHPWVDEVRVIVREDQPGEQRLVAYVVGEVNTHELFEHLRESLPEYMVPAAIVLLDSLPLTPNGKLDFKALPAPEYTAAEGERVAPRTPAEEVLAGIWADVLHLECVGVEDNFFALGGHSLLATRVVSRVRDVFGVELPLRVLFEGPTVAELARTVEEERRRGVPVLPPVVPVRSTAPLPLSFAQERLWFLDRLDPGSTTYNILVVRRLRGPLDIRALERALAEVVRRHGSLRTVFREAGGSAVQVVMPFAGFALSVENLCPLDGGEREAEVRRLLAVEAVRPFDLITGPLFRAGLLRLGTEEHVLLVSMHHIVSDGWSMGVLFRELSALYEAYREGRESPLPELAVQYADYAAWQREHLRGEALERQLAYWRGRLADAPALLELSTDHPRPAVQTFRGAYERFELPGALLEGLRELGRSEGATLYMVVLAAFQSLLARYSGSGDIVVGSPVAGRIRKEVEELIGFFVNTLVMRADLSGDLPFREVLAQVREATLGAYDHQELPFEKLVAELQPERSLSYSPLCQVVFTLQDGDPPVHGLAGVEARAVEAELDTTKFDLTLGFAAHPQGLRGVMTYSTDLFERGTIARMAGHLARVLEQAALRPDMPLSGLDLLAPPERDQLLGVWNDMERDYGDPPVHVRFAEWARRDPQAVALLDGPAAVTYEALDRRASTLARHLRALGVGPETPVGLCTERTPDLLAGVLGIWKAGGAYVPLDPSYPAERLGWIIADAGLPVVVTTEGTAGVLPEHGAAVVRVDGLSETVWEAAPEVSAPDGGLAYVIYTSGSTGRPKGVLVPHGALANLLAATREEFGVRPGDVMPAMASYAFDIWLFETLLPLTSGAAVRLVARERVMDVHALVEEIADATLVHAVPALMRQVVQAERETPRLGRLRRAFVGGDQVPADLLAEMRATFPGAETHVLYGPTEGTILASMHPVPEDGIVAGHPIGRPLGNVRLYVCDAPGSAQPAGVPGELLIGGAGVVRGYLGRPELTAERFVPDPFSREPGARLYRTGDRTRWRGDRTLEYLGRLDAQVKIRGFRIEPGEIEAVLRRHERVAECLVVVREDQPGDQRLVAYVAGGVDAEALREHVRGSLPEYMVPAAFVVLEQLPLTPNGKLDRKALPAPAYGAAADRYVAPRTPVEEVLAGIWAEVLKVERVGMHDGFFELGGHSLLIMRLLAHVQAVFGLEISIRAVFSMPTLEAMAGEIERRIYEDVAALSDDEAEQLVESTPVAGV